MHSVTTRLRGDTLIAIQQVKEPGTIQFWFHEALPKAPLAAPVVGSGHTGGRAALLRYHFR